jgi:hypothetical protein
MEMTMEYLFEEDLTKEEIAEAEQDVQETLCEIYSGDGMTCKVNVTAKKANITIIIDFNKASEEMLTELEFDGDRTYATAKKDLEEDGYTCK